MIKFKRTTLHSNESTNNWNVLSSFLKYTLMASTIVCLTFQLFFITTSSTLTILSILICSSARIILNSKLHSKTSAKQETTTDNLTTSILTEEKATSKAKSITYNGQDATQKSIEGASVSEAGNRDSGKAGTPVSTASTPSSDSNIKTGQSLELFVKDPSEVSKTSTLKPSIQSPTTDVKLTLEADVYALHKPKKPDPDEIRREPALINAPEFVAIKSKHHESVGKISQKDFRSRGRVIIEDEYIPVQVRVQQQIGKGKKGKKPKGYEKVKHPNTRKNNASTIPPIQQKIVVNVNEEKVCKEPNEENISAMSPKLEVVNIA